MPCEDAPCCGCCTPMTERDHQEAADSYREQLEAEFYDESMDGDHESALATVFPTDEDCGFYDDMQCEGYDEN